MGQNINNNNNINSSSSSSSSSNNAMPPSRIRLTRGGCLYDVTDFAVRHPGGRELLEKHNGQDIETVMQDPASHIHSKAAYTILEKYRVPLDGGDSGHAASTGLHVDDANSKQWVATLPLDLQESRVRVLSPAPWPDRGPESLR
ncbi:cytochrome b5-like protein [Plakobranchus ocellatus]|uniref:Cytochrome b5-like protein n=1 Tax=Plakobranchus ocellatus TaxID=259542 RepID=A0AAV4DYZ4_9GAST|nr:cytochrome b5-like protein [Plakobranchus ocellatus]